ncbi:hypothetical protein COL516b_010420 [Colletotrichum fioriniae]|nr:uncharacterized protein COL516b_010420 [Colletotrichum fioriniae]KAJ0297810.1 hypothetical protein COL516b_010420 [Colletotrichum fioriniae]
MERGSSTSSEQEVDGLGQVNEHTEGAEFYGPTGTFYFLARLRSRANTQKQPEVGTHRKQSSIVNLLHSSDYSTPPDSRILGQNQFAKASPQSNGGRRESYQQGVVADVVLSAVDAAFATELERECVRLYFQNLHNIHPILEQMTFLKRCLFTHTRCRIHVANTTMKHFPNSAYCLINPMVDLAKILMWMTDNLGLHSSHTSFQRLSQTALNLDRELDDWKSGLPRQLRFDTSSLEDSEFAMKQKTVLKLRMLRRPIMPIH